MDIGAVYLRVSTEEQTEYSPDAQLNAIKEYARKNDILITDEYIFRDDGISGRKADKRPGFQSMIAMAKKKPKPFDMILVHKFDRFARSREDSIVYKSLLRKDCGIKVMSITEPMEDDKMSVIMEAMLEAMAEYYSLNLAEEVRKGMFEKARRGENIGRAPYGYKLVNSKLVPEEAEAEAIKKIFEMYQTESASKVTQYLNKNVPSRKGAAWCQSALVYILQNPVYYGVLRYNYRRQGRFDQINDESEWILAESDHEPLITKDLFDKTQEKLAFYSATYNRHYAERTMKSYLQHMLKCSACGATLTLNSSQGGKYHCFRCPNTTVGKCNVTSTYSVAKIGNLVANRIKSDLGDKNSIVIEKTKKPILLTEMASLDTRLKKNRTKQELSKKAYLAEVDSLEEYKQNKKILQEEELEIIESIKTITAAEDPIDRNAVHFDGYAQLLESDEFTLEAKNKIIKQFVKKIDVDLITKEISVIYYI